MMRWFTVLFVCIGSLLVFFSSDLSAQSLADIPFPRYAAGIGLCAGLYPIHYDRGGGEMPTYFEPEMRLYYQLTQRLSIQAGGFRSHEKTYSNDISVDSTGTVIGRYQGSNELTSILVHVLSRYSLTKRHHRISFDIMAGFSYLYAHRYNTGAYADYQNNTVTPYNLDRRAHNLLLTFGPSIRCAFGRHLEVTGDFLLHNPLGRGSQLTWDNITSFNGPALGLRYRFHYR